MQYFGGCDIYGNPSGTGINDDDDIIFWRSYTCPDTGQQLVSELSCDCYGYTGTPSIRLAIYDETGATLIAQGASAIAIGGASDDWRGHMSAAALSVNPLYLTGGANYILAVTVSAGSRIRSNHIDGTRTNGYFVIPGGDYTTGFPASLTGFSPASYGMYPVRCKVTASNPSTLTQEGFLFRNDDGSESSATPMAAQDSAITAPINTNVRLRFLIDSTSDATSKSFQLEWKKGAGSWTKAQ